MAVLSQKALRDGLSIRRATADDVPLIQAIVNASYSKYIERIGKPPAPMVADYNKLLSTRDIYVLESTADDKVVKIVGSIILGIGVEADAVMVNNLVNLRPRDEAMAVFLWILQKMLRKRKALDRWHCLRISTCMKTLGCMRSLGMQRRGGGSRMGMNECIFARNWKQPTRLNRCRF
ncbi:acyl-CoA N-acyltransferase [Trichoderma compactum]